MDDDMGHDDGLYGSFDHEDVPDQDSGGDGHDGFADELSAGDDHFAPADAGHDEFAPAYSDHASYDEGSDPYVAEPSGHDEFEPADAGDPADAHESYAVDDTSTPVGALTDMPYDIDDGTSGFPPHLDLGIDAPADGGPWLDVSLLGDSAGSDAGEFDDPSGASAYAVDIPDSPPGGLADLSTADAAGDGTSWTDLAQSDDPAVHSLATLWTPAA
jgi:hypothetical protein